MATATDRVTREDLVMFINACFACTGQREFYADARGQRVSIEFLHDYILGNYRLLYARSLAAGVNHFSRATALVRLLASGREASPAHRAEEGALIAAALASLPVHRAYHALEALARRRVNNRRARAIVREYLARRRDAAFEAVKYRRSLRAAAAHVHLRCDRPAELGAFLFRGWKERRYAEPLFETFRRAHYADEAVYALPFTIAEGLAAQRGVPREVFLRRIVPRLSAGERLRLQASSGRALGESFALDLATAPPTRLASYLLSLPAAERAARRDELSQALDRAAHRAVARTGARYGRVAAVLDASYSSSGSSEKRRRPLAVALAASAFLRAASREYRAFWTSGIQDDVLVEPRGATDLATPLLEALAWGADLIVLVSDGHENDPPSGAAEILRVYAERLARPGGPFIVHLNPVFDSEGYAPRPLSEAAPTVGLREAEDLPTMIGFARFASGASSLAELEGYLAERAARFVFSFAPAGLSRAGLSVKSPGARPGAQDPGAWAGGQPPGDLTSVVRGKPPSMSKASFSRVARLDLAGLDPAPPQVLGSVRLVPLLRREVRPDLRLAMRRYAEPLSIVGLEGDKSAPRLGYVSFVPHGLVASWTDDGSAAAMGAALGPRDGKALGRFARLQHRMAKREDDHALRFLPLHLAMEGFLSLCFAGPDVAWPEWSRRALSRGLDPRAERSVRGAFVPGLADALRVFEIHERQAGVLVFVADALASAFVVPHPDDYRALHRSLLEDFYGELLHDYGLLYPDLPPAHTAIDARAVGSLADLAAGVTRMRREWADFAELLAAGVLDREARFDDVYALGAFRLERFVTRLALHEENHLGERIVRADGTTEYLKTYRLSDAQARRAHLLEQLHAHEWHLARTAAALRTSVPDLVLRVEAAGFGYLFEPGALAEARRAGR